MNFWSFVVIFIASAIALNYWIRFRYLNVYTTLKEPPLVKSDVKELHPDVNVPETSTNFHNYLDDFLQAVRIFGFLEKPVSNDCMAYLVKGTKSYPLFCLEILEEVKDHSKFAAEVTELPYLES